jgi:DNA-binding NarL/FixJ family response regulator
MEIIRILLVSCDGVALSDMANIMAEAEDIEISWAKTGANALKMISHRPVALVIADEYLEDMPGLEFAKSLVTLNPFINCAVVSSFSPEDFHQVSEGLGLMAQLPEQPNRADTEKLMGKLRKIRDLTTRRENES